MSDTTVPGDTPMLLTVGEAAAQLRVDPTTLRKLIADGELGSVRIGRKILVAPDQLTEFIDNNRRPAVSPASLTAEERAATAALTDAERAAARTVAIAEMTARAKERAENPWGRSIRGKRRITAL